MQVKGVQRNNTKAGAFTGSRYNMEQSSEESDDEGSASEGGWPFWEEDLYYHFGHSSDESDSASAGSLRDDGSFGYHFESSEESEEDPLTLEEGASLGSDDEPPLEGLDGALGGESQISEAEESLSDCVGRPSDASDGSQSGSDGGSQAQEEERIPVTCNKVRNQV
jgi:hypothetical protein